MIRQVFYVSRASTQITEQMVQQILAASRLNNWRLDITGRLLFSGAHFAQFLEGTPANLQELLGKIARDRRHQSMSMLLDQETTLRRYGDWSMSFLYKSAMSEELERLVTQPQVSPEAALALSNIFHPDTVMGSL